MKRATMTLKDIRGDDHMKVIYCKGSLIIQEIQLWDDIASAWVEIKPVWRYKRDHYATFDRLEKKVAQHHYDELVGEQDEKEDAVYQTHKDEKAGA